MNDQPLLRGVFSGLLITFAAAGAIRFACCGLEPWSVALGGAATVSGLIAYIARP